ncbi:hypothetical protein J26TS2_41860 [Shouchella clausii]|nr:hypothetical protein J26TS2_41860 [Shouchella clausii]
MQRTTVFVIKFSPKSMVLGNKGYPGFIGLVTILFEEMPDGKTKFTETTVYQSVEDRDSMVKAGMSAGAFGPT